MIHVLTINHVKNGKDILSSFFASNNSTNELNLHFQNGAENRSIWESYFGKEKEERERESKISLKNQNFHLNIFRDSFQDIERIFSNT